jgi:hypothetical protein
MVRRAFAHAAVRFGSEEALMGKTARGGRRGGVNIGGGVGSVGGDIVGGNKSTGVPSPAALDDALNPLSQAIGSAPADARAEAQAKLDALQHQAAKSEGANDRVMAKLVEGLVGLVPAATSAVVSAFTTPILGGIAGPATKLALKKIQGGD